MLMRYTAISQEDGYLGPQSPVLKVGETHSLTKSGTIDFGWSMTLDTFAKGCAKSQLTDGEKQCHQVTEEAAAGTKMCHASITGCTGKISKNLTMGQILGELLIKPFLCPLTKMYNDLQLKNFVFTTE